MGWRERVDGLHEAMDRLYDVQARIGQDNPAWREIGKEIEEVRNEIRKTGPYIPDSPGATVPAWMDAEEAAEYRATSPEYAHDLTYEPDPDIYMDYDWYDHNEYSWED